MITTELLHDTAIKSRAQDALYRAGYAEGIARSLTSFSRGIGVVVGLYGEWGSGKSSVKNMILESLSEAGNPFKVLEFNPWQYESSEQLAREFFAELAIATTAHLAEGEARERRTRMLKYASRLANVGAISLSASVPLVGPFALASSKSMEKLSDVLTEGSSSLIESSTRKSLSELKAEISADLNDLQKPVLVVVDDIDRLDAAETRLMFKVVKANADFPNVHYLLLFQRDRVERALSDDTEIGAAFLEKIISVGFDLPPLEYEEESKIFEDAAKHITEDWRITRQLDRERWERLKEEVLLPSFVNVRQVKRYLNALTFSANALLDENGFNADFVDLAGLEFLRVQEPEVYASIRAKGFVLTEYGPTMMQAFFSNDIKAMLSDILDPVTGDRRESVEKALDLIFPNIDWQRFTWRDAGKRYNALKQKRLWRAAFRGGYFGFDHRKVSLTDASFKEFLKVLDDPKKISAWLDKLPGGQPQRAQALHVIESRLDEIPAEQVGSLLAGIWSWSDRQPVEVGTVSTDLVANAVEGLTESLLEKLYSRDDRRKAFFAALDLSPTTLMAGQVLIGEKARRKETRLLDSLTFTKLKDAVVVRLRKENASDRARAKVVVSKLEEEPEPVAAEPKASDAAVVETPSEDAAMAPELL